MELEVPPASLIIANLQCWCFAVLSLYALPFYLKRLTCKRIMADYGAARPCAFDNKVRKLPVLEVYYDDRSALLLQLAL